MSGSGRTALSAKERTASSEAPPPTAESAMAAAAAISWPKGGGGDKQGDKQDAKQHHQQQQKGGGLSLPSRAYVLLGLHNPTAPTSATVAPQVPTRQGSGSLIPGGGAGTTSGGGAHKLSTVPATSGAAGEEGPATEATAARGTSPAAAPRRPSTEGKEGGASPPPSAPGLPKTSPGSGEKGPTRQQMAAAQVAKRKEALKQGRGLMESSFLIGVGVGGGGGAAPPGGGGMMAAALAAAGRSSGGISGGNGGGDDMEEDDPRHLGIVNPSQNHHGRTGGELQLSPGYQALAAAATGHAGGGGGGGGKGGGGYMSPASRVLSPKSGVAAEAAAAAAMDEVKNMTMLQHFRAHAGAVWCAEFSRKGQYLATGGADGLVKVGFLARVCVRCRRGASGLYRSKVDCWFPCVCVLPSTCEWLVQGEGGLVLYGLPCERLLIEAQISDIGR